MIEPTHVIVLDEVADDMNEGKIFLISKRFPYAIYYDISDKVLYGLLLFFPCAETLPGLKRN